MIVLYSNSFTTGELSRQVHPFLLDGEELLWCGKPFSSVSYRPPVFLVVFSIFWLGFALFWTVSATAIGGPFGLFGIPFLAVGIALLYRVLIGQKATYERTVYAVTDLRVIMTVETRGGTQCHELSLATLPTVSMCRVRGTVGSISFLPLMADRYGRRTVRGMGFFAFESIDSVQEVYRLISQQVARAKK